MGLGIDFMHLVLYSVASNPGKSSNKERQNNLQLLKQKKKNTFFWNKCSLFYSNCVISQL